MRGRAKGAAVAAGALTGALLLTGCGSSGSGSGSGSGADSGSGSGSGRAALSVASAYMPQPVSDMAAGFLTIANAGGAKDELTSVTSDIAGSVTVHQTQGGAMREVAALPVPAHGRVVFRSGGNHLMFEQLKRRPKQGENVTVTLHFARSGTLEVRMPVKAATYNPATGH
ncbi:copper chaperone PCu(A)C [Streptomyces sp. NPDC058733]|uniref:copper chaperone PCu(A)C n=1 Tax=unclassified Streptomyces TaxID=2593676 RepID=UPI0034513789